MRNRKDIATTELNETIKLDLFNDDDTRELRMVVTVYHSMSNDPQDDCGGNNLPQWTIDDQIIRFVEQPDYIYDAALKLMEKHGIELPA